MITLFSTGCPKCKILAKKLLEAKIKYNTSNDIQEVIEAGFMAAPVLKIDDKYYDFNEAIQKIKEL